VLELQGDRDVLRADSKVLPSLDLEQVLADLAALRARASKG
jgi:hypothetical protein